MLKHLAPLVAASVLLTALPSLQAQETLAPEPWTERLFALRDHLSEAKNRKKVFIPFLHSPALERAWGKPELLVGKDGSYLLSYQSPHSSLDLFTIHAFSTPFPALSEVPVTNEPAMVNDELATIRRHQEWEAASLILKRPDTTQRLGLRYFQLDGGGGADAPLYATDTFTITLGQSTGYYVLTTTTVSESMEQRLQNLALE